MQLLCEILGGGGEPVNPAWGEDHVNTLLNCFYKLDNDNGSGTDHHHQGGSGREDQYIYFRLPNKRAGGGLMQTFC